MEPVVSLYGILGALEHLLDIDVIAAVSVSVAVAVIVVLLVLVDDAGAHRAGHTVQRCLDDLERILLDTEVAADNLRRALGDVAVIVRALDREGVALHGKCSVPSVSLRETLDLNLERPAAADGFLRVVADAELQVHHRNTAVSPCVAGRVLHEIPVDLLGLRRR